MNDNSFRLNLRDLSLATRLVIAIFLVSVGLGYFSALVQLHFQHANSGNLLPGAAETLSAYWGHGTASQLQRVLEADESKPFNGGGSMKPAFTTKSAGWRQQTRQKPKTQLQILRHQRDGERLALIDWIKNKAPRKDYDEDSHLVPESLANLPVTDEYLVKDEKEKPVNPRRVKIKSIIDDRCVRCHAPGKSITGQFPLDTYDNVYIYCEREIGTGMSLTKLAQSTHVHLLSFSMLFGLTGVIFSLTSYPRWIRVVFGPFTLIAQIVDISFWWLGRMNPILAQAIMVTGGLVAIGLAIQILGSLFNMFGKLGNVVLVIGILVGIGAGLVAKEFIIEPYLSREELWPDIRDINRQTHDKPSMDPETPVHPMP